MDRSKSNPSSKMNLKRKISSLRHNSGEEEEEEYVESEDEEELIDSEPDVECESWDDDTKILTLKPETALTGYHLMPTCSRNPDDSPNKKMKLSPEIRRDLLETTFRTDFRSAWNSNKSFTDKKTEVIVDPFKVCVITDFLVNLSFLSCLREEFNEVDWNLRSMDLYEFFQSSDLKHLGKRDAISSFYRFLQDDVMKWVADLTGFNLSHVSATCSLYSNTDYLLVHDDQRGDRMVAFVMYITEDWDEDKGGALQLLAKDKDGHPSEVVRSIYPAHNQLVFFPVANDSYHQVAEVTSLHDCRLSINGWFHTKAPPIFTSPSFKPHPESLFGEKPHRPIDFDGDLASWLTEEYLACDVIDDIQEYFEENSEISLRNFLKREPFDELTQILQNCSLDWIKVGPPNRHCYELVDRHNLPRVLERLLQLFQSKQMFALLQRCTGLDLSRDRATMKMELQRWTPGCYSLLGDYGWYSKKELDLVISFGCKCNSDVIGARTMYVTMDDKVQDALITLDPEENNLNLVYRDTARFTKYYSKLSRCRCFYTLFCSYSE